jgi:hypothetical protein
MGRRPSGSVHVVRVRSRHRVASGEIREYASPLLRRSFRRADGTVGKQTVANLSMLPAAAVDAIEAVLRDKTLIDADAAFRCASRYRMGMSPWWMPRPAGSGWRSGWVRHVGNGTWRTR